MLGKIHSFLSISGTQFVADLNLDTLVVHGTGLKPRHGVGGIYFLAEPLFVIPMLLGCFSVVV